MTSETIMVIGASGGIELSGDTLLIAIDKTGHEDFAPTHRVFGIGGCACLVKHVGELVDAPWRGMKAALFGGADVKMNVKELRPSQAQLDGLDTFFTSYGFVRLGVMVSDTVKDETEHNLIKLVGRIVVDRISDIASNARPIDVAIVMESTDRTGRELMEVFSSCYMKNGTVGFQSRTGTLLTSAGWSMLEVAHFVMRAAQEQVRTRLNSPKDAGKSLVRKDFEVVFRSVDQHLAHYTELLQG